MQIMLDVTFVLCPDYMVKIMGQMFLGLQFVWIDSKPSPIAQSRAVGLLTRNYGLKLGSCKLEIGSRQYYYCIPHQIWVKQKSINYKCYLLIYVHNTQYQLSNFQHVLNTNLNVQK